MDVAAKFNLIPLNSKSKAATACSIKMCVPKQKQQYDVTPVSPITNLTISDFKNIALKDFSYEKNEPITEHSPYIEFFFDEKRVVVKKSSFCWLLRGDVHKLSNDRLLRVQASNGIRKINKPRAAKKITAAAAKKKKNILNVNLYRKRKY